MMEDERGDVSCRGSGEGWNWRKRVQMVEQRLSLSLSFFINDKPGKLCYLLSSRCWPNNYILQFHCGLNVILYVDWQNIKHANKKANEQHRWVSKLFFWSPNQTLTCTLQIWWHLTHCLFNKESWPIVDKKSCWGDFNRINIWRKQHSTAVYMIWALIFYHT